MTEETIHPLRDWDWAMRGARYHEAGHAVVAHYNGWTVKSVVATDHEWHCYWNRYDFGGWSDAWRAACTTLAGQLADHMHAFSEWRPRAWEEFVEDAEFQRELLYEMPDQVGDQYDLLLRLEEMSERDDFGPMSPEECYRAVVEDTIEQLSEHWTEVEAVVRALERTGGRLDDEAFVEALEKADNAC
jgi:hypothetical protein